MAPQISILDFMFLMSCFLYNRMSPAPCNVVLISGGMTAVSPASLRHEDGVAHTSNHRMVTTCCTRGSGNASARALGQGKEVT